MVLNYNQITKEIYFDQMDYVLNTKNIVLSFKTVVYKLTLKTWILQKYEGTGGLGIWKGSIVK